VWGDTIDFDAEYAYICDWVRQRMEFIDWTELPLFYKKSYFDELGINMPVVTITDSYPIYTFSGLRLKNTRALKPGLYVKNGKKVIVK
jgi:hypothetical protein